MGASLQWSSGDLSTEAVGGAPQNLRTGDVQTDVHVNDGLADRSSRGNSRPAVPRNPVGSNVPSGKINKISSGGGRSHCKGAW